MEIRIYTGHDNAVSCSMCHFCLVNGDKYVDVQREYMICEACITEAYNKIKELKSPDIEKRYELFKKTENGYKSLFEGTQEECEQFICKDIWG